MLSEPVVIYGLIFSLAVRAGLECISATIPNSNSLLPWLCKSCLHLSVSTPFPYLRSWQSQKGILLSWKVWKALQQKLCSPRCLCCGEITKQPVLSMGLGPVAEFLSSRQWHSAAAELPSQAPWENNPLVRRRAKRNQVWFIFSDTFTAEGTFCVFYWKIPSN